MNKYLVKIAKEYIQEVRTDAPMTAGSVIGKGLVGGATAGLAVGTLGGVASRILIPNNVIDQSNSSIPEEVVDDIKAKHFRKYQGTDNINYVGGSPEIRTGMFTVAQKTGPSYFHKDKYNALLSLSKPFTGEKYIQPLTQDYYHLPPEFNRDLVLHELGHGVDANTGRKKAKMILGTASRMVGNPYIGGAIGGALLTNEKTRDYAWAAPLVLAAPTLREEYVASKNGLDMLKQHAPHVNTNKYVSTLRRAFGTYLAPVALTSGALAGMNYLMRKGEEVNPSEYMKED